jgi:hypothetical protein
VVTAAVRAWDVVLVVVVAVLRRATFPCQSGVILLVEVESLC